MNDSAISVVVVGDGTLGQGVVYETLNLAGLHKGPFVLYIEDNGISQSTPQWQALAGSIHGRARAFDVGYERLGGDQPAVTLASDVKAALDSVRNERMPLVLHVLVHRLGPHSKGDDTRSTGEIEILKEKDPLVQLRGTIEPDILIAIHQRIKEITYRALNVDSDE
mgnify:CR=1 FL=1